PRGDRRRRPLRHAPGSRPRTGVVLCARARRDARAAPRGDARLMAVAVRLEPDGRLCAVTAPRGFVAAGVHAGIRRKALDVALVVSTVPAVGAAMFTANRFKAAPVLVSQAHLAQAQPRA